jgi:ABC-type phosphate transport system substrate-binding protein
MRTTLMRTLPILLASSLGALAPRAARAAECTSLGFSHIVYFTGSSAAKPLLAEVGRALAANNPPVTLVYVGAGSCTGVTAVLGAQTPLMAMATASNPPTYWDTAGAEHQCDISTATAADVGISDVFAETCLSLPGGLGSVVDNLGPVQTMAFVVPNASPEKAISAEAAYMVFGFGSGSGVAPWTDPTKFYVRNSSSGTLQMIATAIGVPGNQWFGAVQANSGAVVSALTSANTMMIKEAIGILGATEADDERLYMRELAYKHYGQSCGYLPDSSPTTFDKRNVRDGHYAIWGPIHLLLRPDAHPAEQANVKLAVDYVTGAQQPPGVNLIQVEAAKHVVPQCAMRVKRTSEVGPMSPFTPAKPCGCYYESLTPGGAPSCKSCATPADCDAKSQCVTYDGVGFCEPA